MGRMVDAFLAAFHGLVVVRVVVRVDSPVMVSAETRPAKETVSFVPRTLRSTEKASVSPRREALVMGRVSFPIVREPCTF